MYKQKSRILVAIYHIFYEKFFDPQGLKTQNNGIRKWESYNTKMGGNYPPICPHKNDQKLTSKNEELKNE